MTGAPRGGLRPSLAIEVLLLVLATIIAAQALTIVAIYLAPPMRPPMIGVDEIAAALKGEAAQSDRGRNLMRRMQASPPARLLQPPQAAAQVQARRIAQALGVPSAEVRFVELEPPALVLLTSGNRPNSPQGQGAPPASAAPKRPPPPADHAARPPPGGPAGPSGPGPDRGGTAPAAGSGAVQGEFIAAWRQPDGRWVIVQPEPELEWLRRIAIWIGGGLLVMGPIGYGFARRITAPLRAFAASAEELGRDPQAALVPPRGPAEIEQATRAFNAMQARIQRYVGDRVAMMGAISHDLRTPLTRIRFKVEKADPAVRAAILSDVVQMEQMIAGVLAFIRDAATPAERQPLDLTSLVACAVDEAVVTGADVEMALDEPLIVQADPVALQRLFENLIDNAVKYGVRARVSVRREGPDALVVIEDQGPGLPHRELEKVFTPFYRTEEAKARGARGIGLGLSVARSVARAHGGDVTLRSGPRGLVAEVTLPLGLSS